LPRLSSLKFEQLHVGWLCDRTPRCVGAVIAAVARQTAHHTLGSVARERHRFGHSPSCCSSPPKQAALGLAACGVCGSPQGGVRRGVSPLQGRRASPGRPSKAPQFGPACNRLPCGHKGRVARSKDGKAQTPPPKPFWLPSHVLIKATECACRQAIEYTVYIGISTGPVLVPVPVLDQTTHTARWILQLWHNGTHVGLPLR